MSNVIELELVRSARALVDTETPDDWRRFVCAVARDVVAHLPAALPWKAVPGMLQLPASVLSAAALSGGLAVSRIDGVLHLMVRECEGCLAELVSVKLAVPRPTPRPLPGRMS